MELVDIYGSPTFQKQYEFMPELTVQVLRLTQTYQVAHEKRLDERMRAFRAKHGIE